MRETKTTNPQLINLISNLRKQSREQDAPIWADVADYLAHTRSQRVVINLSNINRHTEKADVVVVPGKILGTGNLNHALTIAAFGLSGKAKEKLRAAKAKYWSLPELVEKNPTGTNVKIIR